MGAPRGGPGQPIGAGNVGALYFNGWGVPRDYRAAVPWLERAAEQGLGQYKQTIRSLANEGFPEAAAALYRLG